MTGASSGIGEATGHAVAARGARVVLVARRAEELDRVVAAIEDAGGTADAYPCDLTDGDTVDAMVTAVLRDHGAVDMLVNNAGARSGARSRCPTTGSTTSSGRSRSTTSRPCGWSSGSSRRWSNAATTTW